MGRFVVPTAAHHSACMYRLVLFRSPRVNVISRVGERGRWESSGSLRYLCRCRLMVRYFIRRILGLLVVPATTRRVQCVPGLEEGGKMIDQACRK